MKTKTLVRPERNESGFALMAVLVLLAILSAIVGSFFILARSETASVGANRDSVRGFYAAEGGLNFRIEQIRSIFDSYAFPAGAAPTAANACEPGNLGSGDLGCTFASLSDRSVSTFAVPDPANPRSIRIPRGERFQDLNASVYDYDVRSVATNAEGEIEAQIEMSVETRLVPLFQFMIFFDKDLEVTPGPAMTLNGPIHTNGDLYAAAWNSVDVTGAVTSAGEIYRGRKEANTCWTGAWTVVDPVNPLNLPACSGGRRLLTDADLTPWNGNVARDVDVLTVPGPDVLDPAPGALYWDLADLRIVRDIPNGTIEIRNPDNSVDNPRTTALGVCASTTTSGSFYNHREGDFIDMLDVDVESLLDCAYAQNLLIVNRPLDDNTEGGLVLYFGIEGVDAAGQNSYGVRLRNAAELEASAALAPDPRGVTFVTNQAVYLQGDFNSVDKKPAAVLCDSINVLSNNWTDYPQSTGVNGRVATETTVNAAFLTGSDSTGGGDGAAFQDLGSYSGGVHNLPRHHETWSGVRFNYLGSLVSLFEPQHVDGQLVVGVPQYRPPIRNYVYDTDFNDPANLPPLTPRFVYVKQSIYSRDFN